MPIKTDWLVANRVIYSQYIDYYATAEVHADFEKLKAMVEGGTAPVHWIVDVRRSGPPTMDMRMAHHTMRFLLHDHMGWAVVCGEQSFQMRLFIRTLARMFSVNYRGFQTPEETLAFLKSMDSSLPDLLEGLSLANNNENDAPAG